MADLIGLTAVKAYLPAFCRACSLVISPSQGMCEVLRDFGVDGPIDVVPNGVDLWPFQEAVEPATRRELGIPDENGVLVYVGRLGPEKNLPFLLRAFAATHHAYEKSNLIIIGDGPERQNLEITAEQLNIPNSVHFLGAVNYEDVPSYLAASDAFVTASVTEVHPLTVIEAMAAGLPILGIRSPGVGDLIDDGVTGLLVSDEDVAAFTAKMVRMIIEGEQRRMMGKNARAASSQYAIERTTILMEERYLRVIEYAKSHRSGFRDRLKRILGRNGR
jgi:glycosyltransferase involved in cell wall biosynthesis